MASALTKAASQAQLQALVRYNPQLTALSRALSSLRGQYVAQGRGAKASAAGITLAASKARPLVQGAYHDAQLTRRSSQQVLDSKLAALGPGAADYVAASARENAGARTRIGEAQAASLQDLTNRQQNAAAGQAYALSAARQQYTTDRAKVQDQIQSTLGEQGAYTASAAQDIADQIRRDATTRRGQDVTARGQDLSHGDRVATAGETKRHHQATEANAGKPKKKALTADQKQHRYDQVSYAQSKIKQLLQADATITRGELADTLKGGRQIKDDKGHVVLAINPVGELWTSVALDLALDGHVSARNVKALKHIGVNPKGPRGDWRLPSRVPGVPQATAIAGSVGGILGPLR